MLLLKIVVSLLLLVQTAKSRNNLKKQSAIRRLQGVEREFTGKVNLDVEMNVNVQVDAVVNRLVELVQNKQITPGTDKFKNYLQKVLNWIELKIDAITKSTEITEDIKPVALKIFNAFKAIINHVLKLPQHPDKRQVLEMLTCDAVKQAYKDTKELIKKEQTGYNLQAGIDPAIDTVCGIYGLSETDAEWIKSKAKASLDNDNNDKKKNEHNNNNYNCGVLNCRSWINYWCCSISPSQKKQILLSKIKWL